MTFKTTNKAIYNNYAKVYRVGYCAMAYLLKYEERRFVWCSACQNENSEHYIECVFAGIPTKYKTQKPVIVTEGRR